MGGARLEHSLLGFGFRVQGFGFGLWLQSFRVFLIAVFLLGGGVFRAFVPLGRNSPELPPRHSTT